MPVTFTVWSDALCPWCYVATVRLERLAAEAGDDLVLRWRSFLLRPEPSPRSLPAFRRYTESWRRPAEAEPEARFRVWSEDTPPPTHSVPAAVAEKAAATFGTAAFRAYHRALFDAYFTEHRTVSDRAVLVAVAASAGLDTDAFDRRLTERGAELQREVFADHHAAVESGIVAVPSVVVDGHHLVQGAVDVEHYRRVLDARRGA